MLQRTAYRRSGFLQHQTSDFKDKRMIVKKELGMWLYKRDSLQRFQQFCSKMNVKARGNVKIVSTDSYARCLRSARVIHPGQAVLTAPPSASLNFLVANREMYATQHNFPLDLSPSNWNKRLDHLPGAATHEMLAAGWITRQHCRQGSLWSPYAEWLMEDTTGRDGIGSGISRERGDGNPALDQLFSDMANDCGEELDEFNELFFRAYAAIMKRAVPIDPRLIALQLPGTGMARAKPEQLFVPTLVPLLDCVPHDEVGKHNCLLDYHTAEELQDAELRKVLGLTDRDTSQAIIGNQGLISLRAIEFLEEGTYLSIRGWPKTDAKDAEYSNATILEQSIARNNAMAV
jgi:hypothetical protein